MHRASLKPAHLRRAQGLLCTPLLSLFFLSTTCQSTMVLQRVSSATCPVTVCAHAASHSRTHSIIYLSIDTLSHCLGLEAHHRHTAARTVWFVVCRNSVVAINRRTRPARPHAVAYARMACKLIATALPATACAVFSSSIARTLGPVRLQLPFGLGMLASGSGLRLADAHDPEYPCMALKALQELYAFSQQSSAAYYIDFYGSTTSEYSSHQHPTCITLTCRLPALSISHDLHCLARCLHARAQSCSTPAFSRRNAEAVAARVLSGWRAAACGLSAQRSASSSMSHSAAATWHAQ